MLYIFMYDKIQYYDYFQIVLRKNRIWVRFSILFWIIILFLLIYIIIIIILFCQQEQHYYRNYILFLYYYYNLFKLWRELWYTRHPLYIRH